MKTNFMKTILMIVSKRLNNERKMQLEGTDLARVTSIKCLGSSLDEQRDSLK